MRGRPSSWLVGQSSDGAPPASIYDLCPRDRRGACSLETQIECHPYDSDKAFTRVADGASRSVLSRRLIHRRSPSPAAVALVPAVYFVSTAAMVPRRRDYPTLSDSRVKSICVYQGDMRT